MATPHTVVIVAAGVSSAVGSMLRGFGRPAGKVARGHAPGGAGENAAATPATLVAVARSQAARLDSAEAGTGKAIEVAIEP